MKISVVILALVVVFGMVECSTKLQAKLEVLKARLASARRSLDKGVEGEGKLKEGGKPTGLTNTIHPEWPYAWIELVSFVGKCISAKNFFELIEYTPEEGILVHACPAVISEMENCEMETMSDAQLIDQTMQLRQYFELFQCVNLQADRESAHFWSLINESDDAEIFEKEAQPLFAACLHTFMSYAEMDKEFEEDVEEVTENNKRVANTLRELISYAKRR